MYPSLTTFPGDLFADFDRLFGWNDWPSSIRAVARGAFPAVNVGATDEAVEIYAFAPGLDPAKIDVSVEKGLLTLSGERASELPGDDDKTNVYANERFAGAFKRVISLPDDVDPSKIDASYRNGVLKVLLPKRENRKPLRVEVKGGN